MRASASAEKTKAQVDFGIDIIFGLTNVNGINKLSRLKRI